MRVVLKCWNYLEELVLGMSLLGLAVLGFIQVVARYGFNISFTWYEELSRYMGVFLTFLGASLGVKYGLHFSMDWVVLRVPPRVGQGMRLVGCLIAAALFGVIVWLGWRHAMLLRRYGVTTSAMHLPMYWAYLPIPVFGFTLMLRLLAQAWGHLKDLIAGRPIGVNSRVISPEPEK